MMTKVSKHAVRGQRVENNSPWFLIKLMFSKLQLYLLLFDLGHFCSLIEFTTSSKSPQFLMTLPHPFRKILIYIFRTLNPIKYSKLVDPLFNYSRIVPFAPLIIIKKQNWQVIIFLLWTTMTISQQVVHQFKLKIETLK